MVRGRRRKSGQRYACGRRHRVETEREAMATALDARRRHHRVGRSAARDPRLGTAFGRLAFQKTLSDVQYQAGLAFAGLYRHHHLMMGLPLPTPRSVSAILVNEGISGSSPSEPVLEAIERLKRRYRAAMDVLDQCDREQPVTTSRRPGALVFRAVCADEDTTCWSEEEIGNLRVALTALARVFRLNG